MSNFDRNEGLHSEEIKGDYGMTYQDLIRILKLNVALRHVGSDAQAAKESVLGVEKGDAYAICDLSRCLDNEELNPGFRMIIESQIKQFPDKALGILSRKQKEELVKKYEIGILGILVTSCGLDMANNTNTGGSSGFLLLNNPNSFNGYDYQDETFGKCGKSNYDNTHIYGNFVVDHEQVIGVGKSIQDTPKDEVGQYANECGFAAFDKFLTLLRIKYTDQDRPKTKVTNNQVKYE